MNRCGKVLCLQRPSQKLCPIANWKLALSEVEEMQKETVVSDVNDESELSVDDAFSIRRPRKPALMLIGTVD